MARALYHFINWKPSFMRALDFTVQSLYVHCEMAYSAHTVPLPSRRTVYAKCSKDGEITNGSIMPTISLRICFEYVACFGNYHPNIIYPN